MDLQVSEQFPNQRTIPPKVEYMLTERGQSLENVLTELCQWGKKYMLQKTDL